MPDASTPRCFVCLEARDSVVLTQCSVDGKLLCGLCHVDCVEDGYG